MSLLGGLFGGNDDEHTVTTSSEYPEDVKKAQQRLIQAALLGMEPYMEDPNVKIAPRNEYQDNVRDVFSDNFAWSQKLLGDGDLARSYRGANDQGRDLSGRAEGFMGAMLPSIGRNRAVDAESYRGAMANRIGGNYSGGALGTAGIGDATVPVASQIGQITGDQAIALSNPFREEMTDVSMRRIDDQRQKSRADASGQAARRGAFGGSGEAMQNFMADKQASEQAADETRRIAYDSYGIGSGLAGQNANLAEGAKDRFINTTQRAVDSDRAAYNTADSLQNSYFNRGLSSMNFDQDAIQRADNLQNSYFNRNQSSNTFDMNALGSMDSLYGSYYNRGRQNMTDDLSTISTGAGLDRNALDTMSGAGGMVYGIGGDIKAHEQSVLDAPYTTFSRMSGFIPSYQPTQTQSQPIYNDPWGSIGGVLTAGSALLGGGSWF